MARITIKPGNKVRHNNVDYEIVAATSASEVILRSLVDSSQSIAPVDELHPFLSNNNAKKQLLHLEEYTEEQWAIARDRFSKIEPLLSVNRTEAIVIARAKEVGVHKATLYRWIELYETTGQLSSLIPATKLRGGPGKTRLQEANETIIRNYVKEVYDRNPTASIKTALKDIGKQCRAAGLNVPHETTIRNRIKLYSKKAGIGNRPGRKRKGNNESAEGVFPGGRFPLDTVQIDHTKLDIMLVDETYRQPIGRPYITVAMDVFSRMIFGFYISLDPPGFFSTGQTLLMGISPKRSYLSKMGIKEPWDIYGLPKTIHVDNAAEFRSRELKIFCEEYRINLEWRPVARPKFGGHIERFVGTLNSALHELPGTTFSNPEQRGDYKPEKHAVFTIRELDEWIARYIVEVYHNTEHSNLGITPRQKYEQGILGDDITVGVGLPDLVDDVERINMFLLPSEVRTIQREGVSIDGIKYFADVLRVHLNSADTKGRKHEFVFRRDPRDISRIYFYDPDLKEYFKIPYRYLGHPSMSLWELKEVQKKLRDEKKLHPSERELFSAYESLKLIQDKSAAKTKLARRSAEAEKSRKRNAPAKTDRAKASKAPSSDSVSISTLQGAWSPDLFKNIHTTDDISVVRLNEYEEPPYEED